MKIYIKRLFSTLVLIVVAGTAGAEKYGNWEVRKSVDEMTGEIDSIYVATHSINEIEGWLGSLDRGRIFLGYTCGVYSGFYVISYAGSLDAEWDFDSSFCTKYQYTRIKTDKTKPANFKWCLWDSSDGREGMSLYSDSSNSKLLGMSKAGDVLTIEVSMFRSPKQLAKFNLKGFTKALNRC